MEQKRKKNKYSTLAQILQRIKSNKNWHRKSAPAYLAPYTLQGLAVANGMKITPSAIPYGLHFHNQEQPNYLDWFWDLDLLIEKRLKIIEQVKKGGKFTADFYERWKKSQDNYSLAFEKLSSIDFYRLSLKDIRENFIRFKKVMIKNAALGYVVDAFLDNSQDDWFEKIIKSELGEQASADIVSKLTAPTKETFINIFELEKLKIAKEIIRKIELRKILNDCEKLARKFFWVRANYFFYRRLSANDIYIEAQREMKKYGDKISAKINEEENRAEVNRKNKQILFKKIKLSPFLRRLIKTVEIFTHIQDTRKGCAMKSSLVFCEALTAAAVKLKIDLADMLYLTVDEFLSEKKFSQVNWREVRKRKKGVLVVFGAGLIHVIPRVRYEKEIPFDVFFKVDKGLREFSGSIAYRGIVRGKARVVYNMADLNIFEEGDVLVTSQTTPEYMSLMKKASAFVTDQGGITCHAAIIAREMKKPCIIGTKIATKVLKDGDFVEVDADKGVVKIV
jgi:phosphohistidine swiveling domain-containing protein